METNMNTSSTRFTFESFGIPAVCWVQAPGVVGMQFPGWGKENYTYSDSHDHHWEEHSLADFREIFGTCEAGELTINDVLPLV